MCEQLAYYCRLHGICAVDSAAMAMMGLIEEVYRLPLCPMTDAAGKQLAATLKNVGLLK